MCLTQKCIEVKIFEIKFYVSHNCTTFRKFTSLRLGKYRMTQKSLDRQVYNVDSNVRWFLQLLYIATHSRDRRSTWGLLTVCAACLTPRLNLSSELRPSWEQHRRNLPLRVQAGYNISMYQRVFIVAGSNLWRVRKIARERLLASSSLSVYPSAPLSIRPSVRMNNSAPTGRTFMKFDIWVFFEKLYRGNEFH